MIPREKEGRKNERKKETLVDFDDPSSDSDFRSTDDDSHHHARNLLRPPAPDGTTPRDRTRVYFHKALRQFTHARGPPTRGRGAPNVGNVRC